MLDQRDHTFSTVRQPGGKDAADYPAWDQPVFAPKAGRIVRTRTDLPDNAPAETTVGEANLILLDLGDGTALSMRHFRQHSIQAQAEADVAAGAPLGRVGRSGTTTWPHLHLDIFRLPDEKERLPIVFRNVRVGLNHVANDPWARELTTWEAQEGFFVERLKPVPVAEPDVSPPTSGADERR